MLVFSSIGIPVILLVFSFFQYATIQGNAHNHFQRKHILAATKPAVSIFPTATPMNTVLVTDVPTPQSTLTPTIFSQPTSTISDTKQVFIMDAINEYRTSLSLSSVQSNDVTCRFAKIRAQEIASNFSHDGFNQRIQNHTLPYFNYSFVAENIAETSNYQEIVAMWKNSPGHAANMRADMPFVCIEGYGNYYAFEGWKPE